MKKITTLLTALTLLSLVTIAGDGIIPSKNLEKEFQEKFARSTDVKWEKVADYYKANFVQNDQYLTAYFDENYTVEAISRHISTNMLPILLQSDLKVKMATSFWITDCSELLTGNSTNYYVTMEDADQTITYQANGNDWQEYERTKK